MKRSERRRGHWDRSHLESANSLEIEVLCRFVEQVAHERDRLGVEQNLLRVDVVGALFAGREREIAELKCTLAEQFLETVTRCHGSLGWLLFRRCLVDSLTLGRWPGADNPHSKHPGKPCPTRRPTPTMRSRRSSRSWAWLTGISKTAGSAASTTPTAGRRRSWP